MSSTETQTEISSSSTKLVLNDIVLLDHIFSLAENSLLARCALVCSDWSRSALAILWDELASVVPLLSILAPLVTSDEDPAFQVFARPILPRNWDRFHLYARRVRRLTISNKDALTLSHSVAVELLRKRPNLVLTPNLVKLYLNSNVQNSVSTQLARDLAMLFMNENLREFMTDLPQEPESVDDLFYEIADRMPRLQALLLNSNFYRSSAPYESSLVELLSSQKSLTTICVPQNALSLTILEALSKLPSLKNIHVDLRDMDWQGITFERLPLEPFLGIGSFPRLEGLRLTVTCEEVIPLLKKTSLPDRLKQLSVFPATLPSAETIKELLETITLTCSSLVSLVLDAIPLDWNADHYLEQVNRNNYRVTSSTLLALNNLPHLETFRIRYPFPLLVPNSSLITFLLRFPKLTKLEFNCIPMLWREPDNIIPPFLDVNIISEIARALPLLQDLTLYLPQIDPDILVGLINCPDTPVLSKLRELDLSSTRISEELKYPLGEYLGKVISPKCVIQGLEYWYHSIDKELHNLPEINTVGRWKDMYPEIDRIVKELRPVRSRVEAQSQRRIDELQDRIKELELELARRSLQSSSMISPDLSALELF